MPDSDIDILQKMLIAAAMVPLTDNYDTKKVELTEPQYPSSRVTISGLPDQTIVIKLDSLKCLEVVFAGKNGECKHADFVIVADTGSKKVVIFIEMKATRGLAHEIIQQLQGAQCFIAYCREIGKTFWKRQNFLNGYEHRFVSFSHTSLRKPTIRNSRATIAPPTEGVHDLPEKMLKISSYSYLHFKHLVGGK